MNEICKNARNKINALGNIAPFNPIYTLGGKIRAQPHSNFLKIFKKYKLVWAVFVTFNLHLFDIFCDPYDVIIVMITSVMISSKFHQISGNMMTSSKKSCDLGHHFDFL